MAFKIEKALTSLFGMYKLQSQGNLPVRLEENVQAVVDLNLHALAAAGVTSRGFGSGVPFLGIMGTFIQDEDWLVIGANVQYVAGAGGEWVNLQLDVIPDNASAAFAVCQMNRWGTNATQLSLAAGETFSSQILNLTGGPFWSRKGTKWQLACTSIGGGATGIGFADLLYYKIEP